MVINNEPMGLPSDGCYFKSSFGIACAGCGGSHAIQAFFHGHFVDALEFNLLSTGMVILALVIPFILMIDLLFKTRWYDFIYTQISKALKIKKFSLVLAVGLCIFWMYNSWKYR
ncbi:MAG: DUF2752 domain-containing protein [Saprospiraceae bacterium]